MRATNPKQGVACVELAIALPFLIFVAFASMGICNYLSTQQTASRIAFDVCHKAETDNLTSDQAKSLASERMTSLGFEGSAAITETSISSRTSLFTIELTVTSKLQNSLKLLPGLDVVKMESSILRKK